MSLPVILYVISLVFAVLSFFVDTRLLAVAVILTDIGLLLPALK